MTTLSARSNSISRKVMRPLEVDVFEAARERLRHVFDTYDRVVVSYSGGKDSTCVLELATEVAKDLDKVLKAHQRHSTVPMHEDRRCPLCSFSWKKLTRIAMFGNPGNRLTIK